MKSLSALGIGLSVVFGCLFLALIAEVYYLLWWKKKVASRGIEVEYSSFARDFVDFFCWKKPSSLSSSALNPGETHASRRIIDGSVEDTRMKPLGGDTGTGTELMTVNNISVLPKLLFTIEEETKEDLESEDGKTRSDRSVKSSRERRSFDAHTASETPYMTPMSSPPFFTPPLTPVNGYRKLGFNPLFESMIRDTLHWSRASPPPKFKFLRDAEEKHYRKALMEESVKVQNDSGCHPVNFVTNTSSPVEGPSPSVTSCGEEDESFIIIDIGQNHQKE